MSETSWINSTTIPIRVKPPTYLCWCSRVDILGLIFSIFEWFSSRTRKWYNEWNLHHSRIHLSDSSDIILALRARTLHYVRTDNQSDRHNMMSIHQEVILVLLFNVLVRKTRYDPNCQLSQIQGTNWSRIFLIPRVGIETRFRVVEPFKIVLRKFSNFQHTQSEMNRCLPKLACEFLSRLGFGQRILKRFVFQNRSRDEYERRGGNLTNSVDRQWDDGKTLCLFCSWIDCIDTFTKYVPM